ncbi:GDP-mannose mannosyl hydrolase [Halopseudomonas salina]|uniref:GDP-mannose mannosyl hydrolase n=1 Tax=Halopseudomonas salina TaxID=1323744 RepID=A0ABQ1PHI7_9GAMM|nr:GDP-mannose mannosyl hydrolase [Halopseudomonas salina]GGC97308.1 GDP-mannose mannosyl hydrolase [Halopseudomonas salina]
MWLPDDTFRTVIASTPLFSMDLIIRNPEGRLLLGKRTNRPAQGFWFVPGGRVMKNETLDTAFGRLTQTELGVVIPRSSASLLDLYEHFYDDCVFGEAPDTHYVVAGYLLDLADQSLLDLPKSQHNEFKWWSPSEMINDNSVHQHSRDYLAALAKHPKKGL